MSSTFFLKYCSRLCSTLNITFAFFVSILNIGKKSKGICPIVIGEVTCHLIAYTLAIQFRDTFIEHFSLHQFGVMICGRCETVVHGVRAMLNLLPN